MKQLQHVGGWHTDCLPSGEFATLYPNQHVLTHLGPIAFTDGLQQPLYVVVSTIGGFKFAGQAWKTGHDELLQWEGGWKPKGPTLVGVSPLIYDNFGSLVYNVPIWGSQGARFVDAANRIWTGDETYAPANGHDLHAWTKLPCGLVIGQRGAMQDAWQVWDGTVHRSIPLLDAAGNVVSSKVTNIRFPKAKEANGAIALSCYYLDDVQQTVIGAIPMWATEAELRALPEAVLPVPDVFAPLGPPRAPGAWIDDLAPYFFGEAHTFPRTYPGPSGHPIHQHVMGTGDTARYFFMKFGPHVGLDRYEEERLTPNFIHQIVDASNPILSSLSDTRWYPRKMQVGLDYVWDAPPHEMHERHRDSCAIFNTWPFFRKQGIYQSWEHFSAGKDFPDCDVIVVYYDNTNGVYAKDRLIELGYKAKGIGNLRWEAHRSDLAMATGKFLPTDATLAIDESGVPMRKNFYHKGGPVWVPAISPCPLPMSPDGPLIPPPSLKKPEVTVTAWTLDEMKNGREFAFIDRENPGFSARVWTENGSMYASFSNPVGFGRTGAFRAIKACPTGPVPPEPPIPPIPPVPGPGVVKFPALMASYYAAPTDPDCDFQALGRFFAECRVTGTRGWLLDAWALGHRNPDGSFQQGQYDGFLPVLRSPDGRFDLTQWNPAYFDRLKLFVQTMNQWGVFCHLTLLELYTWSDRKQGLPFVPDANLGPYRHNVNGVRWGNPDDPTFFSLPDAFLTAFCAKVVQALTGLAWLPEIGNEMPEKAMHERMAVALQAGGWTGPITVNRNEDTPGQYWNMGIDTGRYQRLALHGKLTMAYLDEEYPDEAPVGRPTTFRAMWPLVDASRVILSSDGGGGNPSLHGSLFQVAKDVFTRGGSYEHQLALKRNRFFGDGTLRMADLELDRAFLVSLNGGQP